MKIKSKLHISHKHRHRCPNYSNQTHGYSTEFVVLDDISGLSGGSCDEDWWPDTKKVKFCPYCGSRLHE